MKIKGSKVLITGGAGFIGSHLSERLLKEGAEVVIYDNFSTGKIENLSHIAKDISIIKGDIKNLEDLRNAMAGLDIVIHEAFPYGVATRSLDKQFVEEGANGTFNVLRAAVEENVEKVVYASTVAVYGEQKYLPIDEEHPKDPFLPYGATKYLGELYCSTFSKVYGLKTVSLRYFNVYGPRYATFDHSAMVHFLELVIKGKSPIIYGDGNQIRDYTYIDDIVEGTLLSLKKDVTKGDVFNLGGGQGIRIIDLSKKIIEISGADLKPKFADLSEYRYTKKGLPYGITKKVGDQYFDTRNYVANIDKAKKVLGYHPRTNLDDGIKMTLEWMKNKV